MSYDIATIGTITIDTFLELENICYKKDRRKKQDYYCFPIGGKVLVTTLKERLGGNAANTAVGFAYLKLKSALVTSVGKDNESCQILKKIRNNKVNTRFVKKINNVAINRSYILDWYKDKNDRVILSHHKPKSFKNLKWPKVKWIYLTSLGKYAKVVFDQLPKKPLLAWNPGGSEINKGLSFLKPVLKRTEILLVNRQEAERLLSIAPSKKRRHSKTEYRFLLENLLKLGVSVAVITNGRKGAWAKKKDDKKVFYESGLRVWVEEVTGAGDAFGAGFVTAYIKGKDLKTCLRWGILNASFCIQRIGAQKGLLSLRQLKKKFKKFYKKV